MKRTLRTKIWCAVLAVACVSGVAFGIANLPRVNGIAEVPMNAEDPNKTGNILLEPGQTRELVFIYLLSDESVYVRTDDEAAERDGVKNTLRS